MKRYRFRRGIQTLESSSTKLITTRSFRGGKKNLRGVVGLQQITPHQPSSSYRRGKTFSCLEVACVNEAGCKRVCDEAY